MIQDEDSENMKNDQHDPSCAAQEGPPFIPASNFNLISGMRSTRKSMYVFVLGMGVGLTHTEKLLTKKLKIAKETVDLEAESDKGSKEPEKERVLVIFQFAN